MKAKKPKTISIKQFSKGFSQKQKGILSNELKYYDLLQSFKKSRQEKNLSQETLAKKANINRTTLSRIETGMRNATIETLMKIAQAIDMKLDIKLHS